jgi:predicted O-methyltransferase YrrM
MSYQYPNHFKYPNERIFFSDNIEIWEHILSPLKKQVNTCLEIGALYGGSSVYILEELCKNPNSHHYIMDINTNEYIENNIEPYGDKVTFIKGESNDSIKTFNHYGKTKEFLDFVYIDGNHMSRYVLEDAVNSFYCLKDHGLMIFDDYEWTCSKTHIDDPKPAIDAFMILYADKIKVLFINQQVIIRKL